MGNKISREKCMKASRKLWKNYEKICGNFYKILIKIQVNPENFKKFLLKL